MDDVNFYMLADGVGGNRSGEIASQSALDALEKFIRHNPPEWLDGRDEIFRYLRAAVRYVNQFIIRLSESKPQYTGMATTLVFAYIRENEMYVANIGDSRVYLIHDGLIQQITDDHTYVNDLVKMGAITREEAHNHNRNSIVGTMIDIERLSPSNQACFIIEMAFKFHSSSILSFVDVYCSFIILYVSGNSKALPEK